MSLACILDHPDHIVNLDAWNVSECIIDVPFCSVRPFNPTIWTLADIQALKAKNRRVMINMDGIYNDTELSTIAFNLDQLDWRELVDGFRIQDPGLIAWIRARYSDARIHLNPETGMQNEWAIRHAFEQGIQGFTFNQETSGPSIHKILASFGDDLDRFGSPRLEVFVQGPVLIQYARRRFLADRYDQPNESAMVVTAEDPELPNRPFVFLDTPFGHFMFAHFHRCLAGYADKLVGLPTQDWLIDARGQTAGYFETAMTLYDQLRLLSNNDIQMRIQQLEDLANRSQKPGFFLANNTDYDWRDTLDRPTDPLGTVLSSRKQGDIVVQFYAPLDDANGNGDIHCLNPDDTAGVFNRVNVRDLDGGPVETIVPFTLYRLSHWVKGIQTKGVLFRKNP